MENKILVLDEDGKEIEIEQITDVHLDSTNKDYIVYTKNETTEDAVDVYIAQVTEENDEIILSVPETEEEVNQVKEKITNIIRGDVHNG